MLLDGGHASWFTWLITLGEIAVGVGLVFGALAGSASTNPVLFTLAIGVILAWRVAGYYGLDRTLLPRLGTPWTHAASAAHGPGG